MTNPLLAYGPPTFDVLGSPEDPIVNKTLANLINAGAQPMSWGDRLPPHLSKMLNACCLIYDGKDLYPEITHRPPIDSIVCIQTYRPSCALEEHELLVLAERSKCLYDIPQSEYYTSQRESMLKSIKETFVARSKPVVKEL